MESYASYASAAINLATVVNILITQKDSADPVQPDAICVSDALVDELESWGSTKARQFWNIISVFDVTRDGEIISMSSESSSCSSDFCSKLPGLEPGRTRIFLRDLQSSPNFDSTRRHKYFNEHQALRPGRLVYEEGNELSCPTFEALQTRTFDIWNLKSLWQSGSEAPLCPFYLQTNVLESLLKDASRLVDEPDLDRRVLFFGRHTIELWQCLSSVHTQFLSEDRLEVTCRFPCLPMVWRGLALEDDFVDFSLLKYHFLRRIHSKASAMSIKQKSSSFACQMIVLDLLAATIECWILFLAQILPKIRRYVPGFDERSRLRNASALENFVVVIRDLELAFQYTLRAALGSIDPKDESTRPALAAMEVELTTKIQSLRNKVQDMIDSIESNSAVRRSIIQENQTLAVNRLTVLAAIFLPISLASSLLSMSTRVVDLGTLWYDYFGLSSTLILGVYLAYCIMRGRDDLEYATATKLAAFLDRLKRKNVLGRNIAKGVRMLISLRANAGFQKRGVFWSYVPELWSLCAVVTASFWVGMVTSYQFGLRVLWIGVIAWFAFWSLVILAIWIRRIRRVL